MVPEEEVKTWDPPPFNFAQSQGVLRITGSDDLVWLMGQLMGYKNHFQLK